MKGPCGTCQRCQIMRDRFECHDASADGFERIRWREGELRTGVFHHPPRLHEQELDYVRAVIGSGSDQGCTKAWTGREVQAQLLGE